MIKKINGLLALILVLAMTLSLCACASSAAPEAETTPETKTVADVQTADETAAPEETEEQDTDITTGKPWLASTVQGVVTENTETNLKDDFFLAVNKDAILNYEIEDGRSSAGLVVNRSIENDNDILALFTEQTDAESDDAKLALELYNLFMDWDSRNEAGVAPLKEMTDLVEEIENIEQLNTYYTTCPLDKQSTSIFACGPTADLVDSSQYIMYISTPGLLLEDSAEYTELTEYGSTVKEAKDELVMYILQRLGYSEEDAAKKLANCYEIESMMAPTIYTSEESNSPDIYTKVYNLYTNEEAEELEGSLPILENADLCGFERKEKVIVASPAWLESMQTIYTDENIDLIKDYMIIHQALSSLLSLDRDCCTHYLDYTNKVKGTEGYLSDEHYASDCVISQLPWAVSRLYVEKYVTEEDKEIIRGICEDVKTAYAEMLAGEDFISEQTKQKAIEKLECIKINALYPDNWDDYSYKGLSFLSVEEGGTYFDACKAISLYSLEDSAKRFKNPVDKDRWEGFNPTIVNAFYNPSDNSINMMAAICRGDIFNADMPIEEMYAKVGGIIGHEISHSFDATGSQFDKDGNMINWWTDEDMASFSEKIQKIADYASSIQCWEGTNINGTIVTGEACADMGGIAVMLLLAKGIEGFDYDLFFRSYASLWSGVETYNYFLRTLKDVHPPEFYRVNATVQQFEEFYECYGIEEGDGMYLAPEDRISVW